MALDMNDPEIKEIVRRIESGELHFEAPCEGANRPWTPEEIADLIKMLNEED